MQNTRITKPAFVVLFLQLIYFASVQAQSPLPQDIALPTPLINALDQQLNITSGTEDYVIQNQRQYAHNIIVMDSKLASFKSTYEKQLGTITTQKDLLVTKLQEVENKIYPLESLDDIHKHCVQKYSWKLVTPPAAQISINDCVQQAINSFSTYASSPTTTRNNLNSYYNNDLVKALNLCKTNNPIPTQNYTDCSLKAIALADTTTAARLKTFNSQLQSSQCSADGRIRTAVDCSFTVVSNSVSAAGEVTGLVENCSQVLESCPDCDPIPDTRCRNELTLTLTATDYQNATIKNPFYGYDGNATCVLVHLL